MSEDQDWRLVAHLDGGPATSSGPSRGARRDDAGVWQDVRTAVSGDMVVTHDGGLLFAYGTTRSSIEEARQAVKDVLRRDGTRAETTVSRWDEALGSWLQIDPAPRTQVDRPQRRARGEGDAVETQTIVCTAGKLERVIVERTMIRHANELGVDCVIVEHPHLLTTQIAFTVHGDRRKLDEFRHDLAAEGWGAIRAESGVWRLP